MFSFLCFSRVIFCFTPWYTFFVFSLFWSPWLPCISNFQPASFLQLFQPSNQFDQQQQMRFGSFKVWFGTKAAKIGDFEHLNIMFEHLNIYELIFHAHIEETNFEPILFIKKSIWSRIMGEYWILRFLPLQWPLF